MSGCAREVRSRRGRGAHQPVGARAAALASVVTFLLIVLGAATSFGSADDPAVRRAVLKLPFVYDLPDTTADLMCPGPAVPAAVAARRKQNMIAAQLELMDVSRIYAERAAGIISCARAYTLKVYRVPGGRQFDTAVRAASARHRVRVDLVDATYSRLDLAVVRRAVLERTAVLAARGADVLSVRVEPTGYVEVGVQAHPDAARRALADLGNRVRVVEGFLGVQAAPAVRTA